MFKRKSLKKDVATLKRQLVELTVRLKLLENEVYPTTIINATKDKPSAKVIKKKTTKKGK